jgi:hypothetical protein
MPWKSRKRKCKQKSTGKSGSYVVVKIKGDGSEETSSCHTSEEKADAAIRARHANEGKTMRIRKRQLRRIIREAMSQPEASRKYYRDIMNDDSLTREYKMGFFDGSQKVPSYGLNAKGRAVRSVDLNDDYRQGYEDASGEAAATAEKRVEAKNKEHEETKRAAQEKRDEEYRIINARKKLKDLPETEQKRLEAEYEKNKADTKRYVRVATPDMTDAMYGRGRRGATASTVWDKKENVLLTFTWRGGSGGSLGT